MSISAMVTFAVKLDRLSLSHLPPAKRVEARLLAKSIWEYVEAETVGQRASDSSSDTTVARSDGVTKGKPLQFLGCSE